MRLALVGNADSGGGSDPASVTDALGAAGHDVMAVPVDDVPDRLDAPVDRVVVAGGDGSIGPAAALARREGVPLAVVPTGTANDFARALELPGDLADAIALAGRADARTRPVDLASLGERTWVNAASAGLSVRAARHAAPWKSALGAPAYALGALRAGLTARPRDVRVRCDDRDVFSGPAWQVVVAQTGAFGGGSQVGAAEDDDGALDVVVLPAGPRLALVRRAFGLRSGAIAEQDDVPHARGRTVEVAGAAAFNVDGELCEPPSPARFAVAGRVEVVVG